MGVTVKVVKRESLKKVKNKEDLVSLLKKYEGILSKEMLEYLTSLLNLDIYNKIAIYNIIKRTQEIFKQKEEYIVRESPCMADNLVIYAKVGEEYINIFDYYRVGIDPSGQASLKALGIGTISLYQFLGNKEAKEAELNRLKYQLRTLPGNPYSSSLGWYGTPVYGGPGDLFELDRQRDEEQLKKKIQELESKNTLTEAQKRAMELSLKGHELMLEEFGLKEEDFSEVRGNSKMSRTLVKEMPNLLIKDKITYL